MAAKAYPNWVKPKQFDANILVIGAGAAGLVTSYISAAVKAKVFLVEQHHMGGDCLNTGCVPSKTLIQATRLIAKAKHAQQFGLDNISVDYSFAGIMQHVQQVIAEIAPHDSIERYSSLGVEVIQGRAKLITPWQVEITLTNGTIKTITSLAIVLATGAKPSIPNIPGLRQCSFLTSDTVWALREKPKRLLVLGGGPIGCELAQCFVRLGVQVTLLEMADRLLIREDTEVSEKVAQRFREEGIDVRLGHTAKEIIIEQGEKFLLAKYQEQVTRIAFDEILLALGRAANVQGYGLEELGVVLAPQGTIQVDGFLRTNYGHIFACGDVAGPYQFTHTAAHQAWYAAVNALFGNIKKFAVDYSIIPWATFTEPEVARVGLNEQEAKAKAIPYEVSVYNLAELDRAITDSEADGFVKVLTRQGKDSILGVTIVGSHAADLLAEFILAMKYGIGLNKILATIHIYPTFTEANKYAAGVWKKNHQPEKLLAWLQRFHAWRRG